jgi:hypothetical protein
MTSGFRRVLPKPFSQAQLRDAMLAVQHSQPRGTG